MTNTRQGEVRWMYGLKHLHAYQYTKLRSDYRMYILVVKRVVLLVKQFIKTADMDNFSNPFRTFISIAHQNDAWRFGHNLTTKRLLVKTTDIATKVRCTRLK